MSCSCIPPPASIRPRKIYNILVPDVFPADPPPINEPVPNSIKRKIGKLHEYVQHSPGKIAKVSRRLNRRIKRALYEKQLGYVKIGVAAYVHLLKQSAEEDSRYTPSYFSKELIEQPDALIDTLINYPIPEVQGLGAELLAAYTEAQNEVDNQPIVVEQLTRSVVRLMLGKRTVATASAATVAPSQQLPKLPEATKAACMMSIREYILFCQRVNKLPNLLAEVQECILSSVDVTSKVFRQFSLRIPLDATASPPTATASANTVPAPAKQQSSADLAVLAMRSLKPYMQDISVVYRLLETQLRYLDAESKWQQPDVVEGMLGLAEQACGDQTYPLFTSLLRHSSAPGLPANQRAIIIQQAVSRGGPYSLSAISLALCELPKALAVAAQEAGPSGSSAPEQQGLRQAAVEGIRKLAMDVGDVAQVCEALAGALRQQAVAQATLALPSAPSAPRSELLAALELGAAAVAAAREFRSPGRGFAPKAAPGSLLTQLCGVVWEATPRCAWTNDAPALEARRLAVATLLQLASTPGFSAGSEERTALAMLAGVAALATATAGPTVDSLAEAEAAAKLSAAAAAAGLRPAVLLQLARLVLALRTCLLKGPPEHTSPVRTCMFLLLVDCLVQQLAQAGQCPGLLKLLTPGSKLRLGAGPLTVLVPQEEGALPVLQLAQGQQPQVEGAEAEARAREGVAAAAAAAGGQAAWAAALTAALAAEGVLRAEYGAERVSASLDDAQSAETVERVRALLAGPLLSQLPSAPGAGTAAQPPAAGVGTSKAGGGATSAVDQAQQLSQRVEESWAAGTSGASITAGTAARANGEFCSAAGQGGLQQATAAAERLNLERVLEILEQDKSSSGVAPSSSIRAVVVSATSSSAAGNGRPTAGAEDRAPLSVKEALELVAGLGLDGVASRPREGRAGGPQLLVDLGSLARQLGPVQ